MIYAEALDELADEQNASDSIQNELKSMASLTEQMDEFRIFLETPSITQDRKKASVRRMFENRVSPLLLHFLMVLTDKDRLGYLPEISKCFSDLQDRRAGRIQGKLISAIALNEQEKNRICEQVNRILNKKANLQFSVDPSLLGGMVLHVEDQRIDASIRSHLERMAEQLYRYGDVMARQADRYMESKP